LVDSHGESVGFFRFSAATAVVLADGAEAYGVTGRRAGEYGEPIRDMIIASNAYDAAKPGGAGNPGRFRFEDVSGLPQTEIDFREDVMKARALVSELVV